LIGWDAPAASSYERLAADRLPTALADIPVPGINSTGDTDPRRPWVAPVDDPFALYCPISKRPIDETGDWAILSNGLLADAMHLSNWFKDNQEFGFPPTDPTTDEPVMYAGFRGHNWPEWLPTELARGTVVRACHRLSVLIADGADLLAKQQLDAVLALVIVDFINVRARANTSSTCDCLPDGKAINVDGHVVHCATISASPGSQSSQQPTPAFNVAASSDTTSRPKPTLDDINVIHSRFERATWTDRVFKGDFFAATPLIACRFVRCRFSACVFVDAVVRDCVFDRCTFDSGLPQRVRGGPLLPDVVDDSVASILVRLGCFRVHGIVQL
jgi:hypothetical protein